MVRISILTFVPVQCSPGGGEQKDTADGETERKAEQQCAHPGGPQSQGDLLGAGRPLWAGRHLPGPGQHPAHKVPAQGHGLRGAGGGDGGGDEDGHG